MENTAIYTPEEVKAAMADFVNDPISVQYVELIRNMYLYHRIESVGVGPDGRVSLALAEIHNRYANDMREALRQHTLNNYPVLAATVSTTNSGEWKDPTVDPAEKGVFFVITEDDYCKKAVHYGNNDWQYVGEDDKIKVLLYAPLLQAPEGYAYKNY